jgi:hypothetical protein
LEGFEIRGDQVKLPRQAESVREPAVKPSLKLKLLYARLPAMTKITVMAGALSE